MQIRKPGMQTEAADMSHYRQADSWKAIGNLQSGPTG